MRFLSWLILSYQRSGRVRRKYCLSVTPFFRFVFCLGLELEGMMSSWCWLCLLLFLGLLSLVSGSPLPTGISYQKQSTLPILTLPYGSYRASSYRSSSDM